MVNLSADAVTHTHLHTATVHLLADDLTGAADASVPFLAAGLRVTVAIDPQARPPQPAADPARIASAQDPLAVLRPHSVLAVSTNSRELPRETARHIVRDTIAALQPSASPAAHGSGVSSGEGDVIRFKKVDSTLRGHLGPEVLDALTAWNCARAVVAPAFPELRRTIVDGRLLIDGVSTGTSLTELFEHEAFRSIVTMSESSILSGMLESIAGASRTQRSLALVCDTTHVETLDRIVDAFWPLRGDTLWVGSSGLARAVARRIASDLSASSTSISTSTSRSPSTSTAGPASSSSHDISDDARELAPGVETYDRRQRTGGCVLFIGSMTKISMRQCAELEADGIAAVNASDAAHPSVARALGCGSDLLVRMRNDEPSQLYAMVKAVAALSPAGLVLSGGDSALRVCRAAGVVSIDLRGELETGVPWGTCSGGDFHGLPVVLKSGGFGRPDTLRRAARFLTRQEDAR